MKTNDLVSWMRQDALPLWVSRGWDERDGGYIEELHPNGTPSDPGFKRVRVQGRQLFSFSTAALLGWHPGAAALAEKGFDFIKTHCRSKDGTWARRLKTDGSILDAEMDLYDTAFIVLGLSTYYRLTQNEEARKLLEGTLELVKAKLSVPGGKGYSQSPGDKPYLRQNPHMHWFEAMLFAYDATKDKRYLDEAKMIYGLAQEYIIDRKTGALRELFDDNWKPALEDGKILVEPGHHYEWSWLLWKAGQVMEVDPALSKAILGFSDRYGVNTATGLVYDQVSDQGELTQSTHRLWVQTETLRAWVIRSDAQGAQREKAIERTEGNILKYYLDRDPRGTWGDRLDVKGNLMRGPVPASSMYHLMACITELAIWRAERKN